MNTFIITYKYVVKSRNKSMTFKIGHIFYNNIMNIISCTQLWINPSHQSYPPSPRCQALLYTAPLHKLTTAAVHQIAYGHKNTVQGWQIFPYLSISFKLFHFFFDFARLKQHCTEIRCRWILPSHTNGYTFWHRPTYFWSIKQNKHFYLGRNMDITRAVIIQWKRVS